MLILMKMKSQERNDFSSLDLNDADDGFIEWASTKFSSPEKQDICLNRDIVFLLNALLVLYVF